MTDIRTLLSSKEPIQQAETGQERSFKTPAGYVRLIRKAACRENRVIGRNRPTAAFAVEKLKGSNPAMAGHFSPDVEVRSAEQNPGPVGR